MENNHSPAANRILRMRADRKRIQPHIDLARGVAVGKPPTPADVDGVRIALLLARREEAGADDLPAATLNLLIELSREAKHALRRILRAVAGKSPPLPLAETLDKLLVEANRGESTVWDMLRDLLPAEGEPPTTPPPTAEGQKADTAAGKASQAIWASLKEASKTFGFTTSKQFDAWLTRHKIPWRRPLTKDGKENPHRREVDVLAVFLAVAADAAIANDPVRIARIQRYRDKLRLDKDLEDAAIKSMLGR